MNIVIVSDAHLRSKGPPSRKDDYQTSILTKLEYSLQYAVERDAIWVFLGDLFHFKDPSRTPISLIMRLYYILQSHSCQKYVIAGNHDLQSAGMSIIHHQPLGLLTAVGVLSSPDEIEHAGFRIRFLNFDPRFVIDPHLMDAGDADILMAHLPARSNPYEGEISYGALADLGYSLIFFGHTHEEFNITRVKNTGIVRVPSISRVSIPTADPQIKPAFVYVSAIGIQEVVPPYASGVDIFDFEKHEVSKLLTEELGDFVTSARNLNLVSISVRDNLEAMRNTLEVEVYEELLELITNNV